jgi:type IV secretory pathway VirB4 component
MALPSKQDTGNSLDLVDIREIKEDVVIMNNGSMHQVIMVGGLNFALKSDSEQTIITQAYQNFLNGVAYPLQIIIHSRKVNISKYIETLRARKDTEPSPILQNQIDEYADFIDGFVKKNAIMEKVFFVVVPYYPLTALPNAKTTSGMFSFLGKKNDAKAEAAKQQEKNEGDETVFKDNLAQLSQRTTQVTNGLLAIGLEVEVLTNEQLVELFYNFYNPQTIERQNVPLHNEQ